MEAKSNQNSEIRLKGIRILKALLCAYALTGILLLLLTLLLYKWNLDEGKVSVGIILIYIVSTFVGGFIIGKMNRTRKFLWGLTVGIIYFALLMLISLGMYRTFQTNGQNVLTTLFICAASGTLGGMLS